MKKRSTAVILAVIIALTTLCISASADTWPNFGAAVAGSSYNQPITDADGAAALVLYDENADGIPETALPAGLNLEVEIDPSTGLFRYYLRGVPLYAGDYSFVLAALFADNSFQLLWSNLSCIAQINLVVHPQICNVQNVALLFHVRMHR